MDGGAQFAGCDVLVVNALVILESVRVPILSALDARSHEFIMSLPEGYGTQVGERGVKQSGGERQRLAIARALLQEPLLYIFDEDVVARLQERSRHSAEHDRHLRVADALIIAHRLSTVVHADQIVVLDDGRVVECGAHQELLSAEGHYAALWHARHRNGRGQQIELAQLCLMI